MSSFEEAGTLDVGGLKQEWRSGAGDGCLAGLGPFTRPQQAWRELTNLAGKVRWYSKVGELEVRLGRALIRLGWCFSPYPTSSPV